MTTATLVHVEIGIEYYKDDSLYFPKFHEKLLWELLGLPEGVEKLQETFETEIDQFIGYTKKEVQSKYEQNLKNGNYNFLPPIGVNQYLKLRF
jgi:hypothetical protein